MAAHIARDRASRTRRRLDLLAQRAKSVGEGGRARTADIAARVRAVAANAGDGEATPAPLDDLGKEWHRIDDIRWPGKSFANVDHVLVGPAGVFVVDNQAGRRGLDTATLLAADDPATRELIHGVSTAAHAVGSLLGMTRRRPVAVLCFSRGDIDGSVGDVLTCTCDTLVQRLSTLPRLHDAAQVRALADTARERLLPATGRLGAVPAQRIR